MTARSAPYRPGMTVASPNRAMPLNLHGFQWWLRPGTSDFQSVKEVVRQRSYFTREFKPESRDRWLDGGANIGAFSVLVGTTAKAVEAYEPHPDNAALAQRNVNANRARARVHAEAISVEAGVLPLGLSKTTYGQWRHSLLMSEGEGEGRAGSSIDVPVRAFHEAAATSDCVKLDIEGAEADVLMAADLSPFRKLVFEWHFDRERRTDVYLDVIERLQSFFPRVDTHVLPPPGKVVHQVNTQKGLPGYVWFWPCATIVRCW